LQHRRRAGGSGAPLVLALFVLAAIPAVSLASGLDAAILMELTREDGRRVPTRDAAASVRSLRAAVSLARRLIRGEATMALGVRTAARPGIAVERSRKRPARKPAPALHHVRVSLLNLPPPAR
jgi:hypothetical protein